MRGVTIAQLQIAMPHMDLPEMTGAMIGTEMTGAMIGIEGDKGPQTEARIGAETEAGIGTEIEIVTEAGMETVETRTGVGHSTAM